MARPKEIPTEPKSQKWECKFEDDDCTEVWKYDSKKTTKGPIEVTIIFYENLLICYPLYPHS